MTLKPTDYLVAVALAVIALFPLLVKGVRLGWSRLPSRQPSGEASAAEWRAGWVQTLMELQSELESRNNQQSSVKLCKQLIWEILGGGPVA